LKVSGVASGTISAGYFFGGMSAAPLLGQLFDRFGWHAAVTGGVGAALIAAGVFTDTAQASSTQTD